MKLINLMISFAVTMAAVKAAAVAADYSKGVFFVNEDWYGHRNSTVNHLNPDADDGIYWHYRVVQEENPGIELGCSCQFGAIWNGDFIFISKQEKDAGATISGGRITVADAKTMKVKIQSENIDPSGAQCDGRGFVGIDAHKGYVSSSNGIWVFNLDDYEITGQVKGTGNPNIGDNKPNTDPTGALYHGQCGSMVVSAGKVFAAHQQYGLLVIDVMSDEVIRVIPLDIVAEKAGIGSVVKAFDGSIWVSVAKNVQGTGTSLPSLVKVNPETLECAVVDLPEGIYGPSNSWYAWTPDTFCASPKENVLYWTGGKNRWFSSETIYRYNIDSGIVDQLIQLSSDAENWKVYGCSMRPDPYSDRLFVSLYHDFGIPEYTVRSYTNSGEKIMDYPMISNYWFPSIPVFPEEYKDGSDGIENNSETTPELVSEKFYDLKGCQVTESFEGLMFSVKTFSDGSVVTTKLIR